MRKSDLSSSRQRILETWQELGFGRIEQLPVRDHEPILSPSPRTVRDIVFGKENGPRSERVTEDFELKSQAVEFFEHLDRMDDGTIDVLVVKHGLPFQMQVAVSV
jgi:hypothetical protein